MMKVIGNIYWQDALTSDRKVELKNNKFICGGKVCYWFCNESLVAHRELDLAAIRWESNAKRDANRSK